MNSSIETILLENKFISKEKLDEAIEIHSETQVSILDILIAEKALKLKDIKIILQKLTGRKIELLDDDIIPDDIALGLLPIEFCREKKVLPIRLDQDVLTIATSTPEESTLLEEIKFMTEKDVDVVYAPASKIEALSTNLSSHERLDAETDSSGEGRIVQLVQKIIITALRKRASDIHIEPLEETIQIRYRIDGVLLISREFKMIREEHPALISRIKIVAGLDISEKRLPQDGRILFKYKHKSREIKEVDIRVSIIPSIQGEAVVLRILDRDAVLINLNSLGFNRTQRKLIDDALKSTQGMILASGPTGSGKTTSLYAMLSSINQPERKILTIEDPVEYQIAGIEQIQAHNDIGLSFAEGLRAFLRHDPDAIMVGEIRDEETAEIAIRASLTGHLVLSTIHTNDAPSSVTRLLDMGIKAYLVASTVTLVVSQRLVRRLCTSCRKGVALTKDMQKQYNLVGVLPLKSKLFFPVGCNKCEGSGFSGRAALYEIMPISEKLKIAIIEEKSAMDIRAIAIKNKMKSLFQAGIERVKKGETSIEEVIRVSR